MSYTFSVLDDGANNPDVVIHPSGAAAGTNLSIQVIDRNFQACDLVDVNGVSNSNLGGTGGDSLSFTWW
jgi:hypothetical protein